MQQKLLPGDDVQFVKDILPFVEDDRYIKIDEKPILIIYRPHLWTQSQVKSLLSGLQQNAKKYNFQFYFIMALTYDFSNDPREWGFSAGVEFPPHNFCSASYSEHITMFNKNFCGHIQDMRKLVKSTNSMERLSFTVFKTAFPNWDNTARRFNNGLIFNHSTPEIYKAWLKNNLLYTIKNNSKDEQFVFINAWNEWGEGAHLEPDRKFGYAYLQATADALASINCSNRTRT